MKSVNKVRNHLASVFPRPFWLQAKMAFRFRWGIPTESGSQRKLRNLAAAAVFALGLSQFMGYALGMKALRGVGAALAASPLPKVFTDVNGFETFASDFVILYEQSGKPHEQPVTPEFYGRLRGPYNRRNVYGAALSYGPRLPEPIWNAVLSYGLRPDGPFIQELGIPLDARNIRVRIISKTRGREQQWILQPSCKP